MRTKHYTHNGVLHHFLQLHTTQMVLLADLFLLHQQIIQLAFKFLFWGKVLSQDQGTPS